MNDQDKIKFLNDMELIREATNVRHIERQTCNNCDYSFRIGGGSVEWRCSIGKTHGTIPYTGALNPSPKDLTCDTWRGPRFPLDPTTED